VERRRGRGATTTTSPAQPRTRTMKHPKFGSGGLPSIQERHSELAEQVCACSPKKLRSIKSNTQNTAERRRCVVTQVAPSIMEVDAKSLKVPGALL
jgi:hypothetical protein